MTADSKPSEQVDLGYMYEPRSILTDSTQGCLMRQFQPIYVSIAARRVSLCVILHEADIPKYLETGC